jgi:hypothetical protein
MAEVVHFRGGSIHIEVLIPPASLRAVTLAGAYFDLAVHTMSRMARPL